MVRACIWVQKYPSLVVGVAVGALRKVAPAPKGKEYQVLRVVRKENILTHTVSPQCAPAGAFNARLPF